MKKVMHKWYWAWDFEEEENWLNEMAADGWVLCDVGFCRYVFEPCEKGEYTVSLQWLEKRPGSKESLDYINFVRDTGAEYIGNVKYWVYFRKKTAEGELNLISDTESQIKHFGRITTLLKVLTIPNLLIGAGNIIIGIVNPYTKINLLGFINLLIAWATWKGYKKMSAKQKELEKQQILFE